MSTMSLRRVIIRERVMYSLPSKQATKRLGGVTARSISPRNFWRFGQWEPGSYPLLPAPYPFRSTRSTAIFVAWLKGAGFTMGRRTRMMGPPVQSGGVAGNAALVHWRSRKQATG